MNEKRINRSIDLYHPFAFIHTTDPSIPSTNSHSSSPLAAWVLGCFISRLVVMHRSQQWNLSPLDIQKKVKKLVYQKPLGLHPIAHPRCNVTFQSPPPCSPESRTLATTDILLSVSSADAGGTFTVVDVHRLRRRQEILTKAWKTEIVDF
ncbi:hypothetical protein Droror1_Dr00013556 [Drosera rotundifolia]